MWCYILLVNQVIPSIPNDEVHSQTGTPIASYGQWRVSMPELIIESFVTSLSKTQRDQLWEIVINWNEHVTPIDLELGSEGTVAECLEGYLDSADLE